MPRPTLLWTSILVAFLTQLLNTPTAEACLWDRDTLRQERSTFPGALELMTGKFPRHSDAYYRWRIEDRKARLVKTPDALPLIDDLAVAYDKLGRHQEAIILTRGTLAQAPDRYETHANLGTFYIHDGRFEEGLVHIDKAIAINPDAHFGREIVQRHLVAYVVERQAAAGGKLPLPLGDRRERIDFASFLARTADPKNDRLSREDQMKALEGVLGMMRFGDHTSAVLLEALGDLLMRPGAHSTDDSGRLAARAYLLAAQRVKDEDARRAYRSLADDALSLRHDRKLEPIEAALERERADADLWIAEVHRNEARWIEEGIDVDAAFDKLYYPDGEPVEPRVDSSPEYTCCGLCSVLSVGGSSPQPWGLSLALGLIGMILLWRRAR